MKKIILILFTVFLILPSMVSAHTSLSSSNPSEGQVVTEPLDEITLIYATTIEELSTMDLMKDGNKIPLKDIRVENKQLIGAISEPLANGLYKIQWKIIGEDGHPITGEINFTVQRDQNQSETDSVSPEENNEIEDNSQTNQTEQNSAEQKNTSEKVEQPDNNSSSTMLVTIAIVLIVIFGIVILFFTGKKKR